MQLFIFHILRIPIPRLHWAMWKLPMVDQPRSELTRAYRREIPRCLKRLEAQGDLIRDLRSWDIMSLLFIVGWDEACHSLSTGR